MANTIDYYNQNAKRLAVRYEKIDPESLHGWLINLLPSNRALILDIGAGTGRDAAWLTTKGHEVVAVEPSVAMRDVASQLHPEAGIRWINDSLPSLTGVTRFGAAFDVVMLSAVWMHVLPADRERAFRKLVNLLKPGGMLALTLRLGPIDRKRGMHKVSLAEIERLARDHGFFVERTGEHPDQQERKNVRWIQVALRLPDDGTGALPLLRHVILNDDKTSTYKLALLRTLCRIADSAAGFSHDHDEEFVSIPLGLVALVWLRLYKPLLAAELPQGPKNIGGHGKLSFVKESFEKLMSVSSLDLRVGMTFSSEISAVLHGALKDAVHTIKYYPAKYMTYPNGEPIFRIMRNRAMLKSDNIRLDDAYLFSFGKMIVPRHIWRALQRFDVWMEPALVAEWTRLIKRFAHIEGLSIDNDAIDAAMVWDEPSRDVRIAKTRAESLMKQGKLYCVWSGKLLRPRMLVEMDHCLPWAMWPCGDLWNLMPAHRKENQKKSARLPSDRVLRTAEDRILSWWDRAYTDTDAPQTVRERFWIEARSSLPGVASAKRDLPDIFDALCLQRMRLKHDQQATEWEG